HVDSHLALGRLWLGLGRADKAIPCFQTVQTLLKGTGRPPEFHRHHGEALMRAKRYSDARKELELAAQEDPRDPGAAILVGDCLFVDERSTEAANWYRKAIVRDARNPFAHHKLGLCLFRLARFEAGLESCLEAVRLKPDYGAAMRSAAIGFLRTAKWRKAREMLTRACREEPESAEFGRLRARVWRYQVRHMVRKVLGLFPYFLGTRRS
ncbi:MAG: tetratricopeptide repeat protein, partial [Burkholderiales bacterium]